MRITVARRISLIEMGLLLQRAEVAGLITREENHKANRAWLRVVASGDGTLSPPTQQGLHEAKAITAKAGIVMV